MKKLSVKNILSLVIGVIVVVGAIVGLYFAFRPEEKQISLFANDITLSAGSSKRIEYQCSENDAVVTIEISDKTVAKVEGEILYGLKEGTTQAKISASTSESKASVVIKIVVTRAENGQITDLPSEINLFLLDKELEQARNDGFDNTIAFNLFRDCTVEAESDVVKISKNNIVANKEGVTNVIFKSDNDTQQVRVNVAKIDPVFHSTVSNVEMMPFDQFEIDYQITPAYYTGNAEVLFESDSGYVEFDGNKMLAKTSGSGTVRVLLNGENVFEFDFLIKANMSFVVFGEQNCAFENGVLKVLENQNVCFGLNVTSLAGELVNTVDWQVESQDFEITREMNYIRFSASSGGKIVLKSQKLVSTIEIKVEVVQEL